MAPTILEQIVEIKRREVERLRREVPLPELEQRERHRGDRRTGEARADFHSVHRFTEYDLDIDSTQPNEGNVAMLITAWKSRNRPTAFDRMATHR